MTNQPQAFESLSEHELRAFAEKLEAWGKGLSPKEQSFLLQILGRASADGDTQGFAYEFYVTVSGTKQGRLSRSAIESALFRVNGLLPTLEHLAPPDPSVL